MRCLYCGKELALLKRLTGGGEFCSDAHRQQYQDEYNQLALTRLLQAKPPIPTDGAPAAEPKPGKAPPPPESAPSRNPAQRTEPQFAAASPQAPAPTPAPSRIERPRLVPPEPIAEPEPLVALAPEPEEELAPADLAGFFVEMPVPALAEVMAMARPDTGFESNGKAALPRGRFEAWETQLVAAGPLESAMFSRIMDCAAPPRDRKLDARDFLRTAPLVEVDLDAAGETHLPEMIEEPMDILIFPHPPQGDAPLWEAPSLEFAFPENLGVLARVAFRTTGVEDNEDATDPLESLSAVALDPALEIQTAPAAPQSTESALLEAESASPEAESASPEVESAPPEAEPAPVAVQAAPPVPQPETAKPFTAPAPTPETVAAPAPVTPKPPFQRPSFVQKPAAAASPIVQPRPSQAPPLVTKPLPVTLHGLAAGRGKPVQVFAAIAAGVDLQIPRSNALPLRPVMTLGPAIAVAVEEKKLPERTVVVKVDPKKTPPSRPDPRLANGKGRKDPPDTEAAEKGAAEKKEPEPKPAAAASAKPAPVRGVEKPAEKPAVSPSEKSTEKPARTSLPAPLAAPYHPPDLGLPSLNLEASGGFWKRLPLAGKAGLALTMVALAMAIVFIMKSGTSAAAGPRVVEAPAITAAEGGWITDWGVEPGVRKVRDISILRPTLNMNDYRMEFEAQIESKALGWIYRATDDKNYYVSKLEIIKPGLTPTVALVRYAMVNGEEQPHAQFPLDMPLRIDTMYKIRFDAVGDRFTTWVQDQKVDDWTDERFKTGGIGLYSDRGESISLKKDSLRVAPLVIKK